ncbi:MAG: hypothetical protein QXL16_00210 [Candidatus Micrarchaeaceae archaeon]
MWWLNLIGKSYELIEYVPIQKVKELMEKREKESPIGYEQQNSLEHARELSEISGKKAEAMVSKLIELGMGKKSACSLVSALKLAKESKNLDAIIKHAAVIDKIELDEEAIGKIKKLIEERVVEDEE